jgi:hypothetical protein
MFKKSLLPIPISIRICNVLEFYFNKVFWQTNLSMFFVKVILIVYMGGKG